MATRSLRSRRALEEPEEGTVINVQSENSVMSRGEVNNLDLRSVSGGEQQEDLGQNQEKDLSSRILEILDRLEKLELETSKRSQDISSLKDETQQRIQIVNGKFSSLINGVCVCVRVWNCKCQKPNNTIQKYLRNYMIIRQRWTGK